MTWLLRLASVATALLGALTVADLKYRTSGIVLWPLKLLACAVAPLVALIGAALALAGLKRRDPLAAGFGLLGALASIRYVTQSVAPHPGFEQAFEPGWQERIPAAQRERFLARRWTPILPAPPRGVCQRNVVYGVNPETGQDLLADLWLPPADQARSGLGVIYVHGGAWRLGTKDMGTRPFFRRLAGQGHVVMDIDYTLAPATDVPGMVGDVKRALIWLKQNAAAYGVNPERIVLIGGSAGGHLALLAAYTPNDAALQPDGSTVDTSVRAVVSFYGPTDFLDVHEDVERNRLRLIRRKRIRPYGALVETLLQRGGVVSPGTPIERRRQLCRASARRGAVRAARPLRAAFAQWPGRAALPADAFAARHRRHLRHEPLGAPAAPAPAGGRRAFRAGRVPQQRPRLRPGPAAHLPGGAGRDVRCRAIPGVDGLNNPIKLLRNPAQTIEKSSGRVYNGR